MNAIRIKGRLMDFSRPRIMGIVNVTPDSFYEGSRTFDAHLIEERVERMRADGADMLDLGGYSSRPGADEVTPEEEYSRLSRGLEAVRKVWPEAVVSIDTFRADVARRCVEEWGADIINDISGGDLDAEMWPTVAALHVPYVLMHMRGTPETMQSLTNYKDVTADVITDLAFKADRLHDMGVCDVIIDPGFGFAKTSDQNYQLLAHLEEVKRMGMPVLAGMSRKSMIYKPLGIAPADSLPGTIALHTIAMMKGADIIRVHDVKEAVQSMRVLELMKNSILTTS